MGRIQNRETLFLLQVSHEDFPDLLAAGDLVAVPDLAPVLDVPVMPAHQPHHVLQVGALGVHPQKPNVVAQLMVGLAPLSVPMCAVSHSSIITIVISSLEGG